jgi:multidrug efflux pump subunit AcrA (membrane-fusion protein)
MYATAHLVLQQKANALAVPVQAVSRERDRATVLLVNREDKIEERIVQLGIEGPNEVEVIAGLEEHDLVVVGKRAGLKPGQPVHPRIVPLEALKGGA